MDKATYQKIAKLYKKGALSTDSDILELAGMLNVTPKRIEEILIREATKRTPCAHCRHAKSSLFHSVLYPCNKCIQRDPEIRDYYVPDYEEEEEEEDIGKTGRKD